MDAVLAERSQAATAEAAGSGGAAADELAGEQLLKRNRTTLQRLADPRVRRRRAYALLARNGFDPEVCRSVSARFVGTQDALDD